MQNKQSFRYFDNVFAGVAERVFRKVFIVNYLHLSQELLLTILSHHDL